MKNQIIQWLVRWFTNRENSIDADSIIKNYFELGLINSFGIIELIEAIEENFNIKLTESNFQDRRFSSIDGLSEIIIELINDKESL